MAGLTIGGETKPNLLPENDQSNRHG